MVLWTDSVTIYNMKYVALLRGINIGGRVIKMAELKILFEDLGLTQAQTVLQSGNVVFEGGSAATRKQTIEDGLNKKFHYPAKVQVYSLPTLQKIVDACPFETSSEYHNYVLFFENGLEQQLVTAANDLDMTNEEVRLGEGVVYWRVLKGLTLQSPLAKCLVKAQYKNYHTNRNINTLQKIIIKAAA
jgi:uncharacterized protein (DUF1697 family)